tara:strand:+ start:124 stop:336 length:213 start_codon:yes stop_codon:yes gene_type:complete
MTPLRITPCFGGMVFCLPSFHAKAADARARLDRRMPWSMRRMHIIEAVTQNMLDEPDTWPAHTIATLAPM